MTASRAHDSALRNPAITRVRTPREDLEDMAREVADGLRAPLPALPSKYFYDEAGGRLFDRITRLPEYYPTRTEEAILAASVDEIVAAARPRELVELGSGLGVKTRLILDAIARRGTLRSCVLLDVDEHALRASLAGLASRHPAVAARGIVGDFLRDLPWLGRGGGRMIALLGGTIGNLHPSTAPRFFAAAAEALAAGDTFLVGIDLVKDVAALEAAYDDAEGVTAEFNRNLLRVMNARLGADFDPESFAHVAFYSRADEWIEMRLRALRPIRVSVPGAGVRRSFARGDEIRTEISCKYTRARFTGLLAGTGLSVERWQTDAAGWFALALLRRG
jgi:L-histidine N-alpha-methyltransferase